MDQPNPFEITKLEDGTRVASDGDNRAVVILPDAPAGPTDVFKRRGISGIGAKPAGEQILPLLNALSGEILRRLDMPVEELRAKLMILITLAQPKELTNHEWLVTRLSGPANVYVNRENVLITTQDLGPALFQKKEAQ